MQSCCFLFRFSLISHNDLKYKEFNTSTHIIMCVCVKSILHHQNLNKQSILNYIIIVHGIIKHQYS